ncbi:hypothetical protein [Rhizobium sp. RAF56]|uniref:hypothetical protein n=1 Tax=Rhizobium sp. RAF56 TaxID=3233062 RepID=UPI003F95D110
MTTSTGIADTEGFRRKRTHYSLTGAPTTSRMTDPTTPTPVRSDRRRFRNLPESFVSLIRVSRIVQARRLSRREPQ